MQDKASLSDAYLASIPIPEYYAVVSHTNSDKNSREFSKNGDIIPRKIQEDLFDRIDTELKTTRRRNGRKNIVKSFPNVNAVNTLSLAYKFRLKLNQRNG